MIPTITGPCNAEGCTRRAVTIGYEWKLGPVPVCRRHICVYRVHPSRQDRDAGRAVWQAEDEYAGLRFCRRSRFRWLAQRRILRDQRLARRGIESRAQRIRRERADHRR